MPRLSSLRGMSNVPGVFRTKEVRRPRHKEPYDRDSGHTNHAILRVWASVTVCLTFWVTLGEAGRAGSKTI
jgi:hypothetical protein